MLEDILNPRRAPRVPLRCAVEIRHRLTVWNGETEDLGPGGCQIVTPRVIDPGTVVRLAIRCEPISRTILAAGQVVWTRANPPVRLGIAFAPGVTPAEWFTALVRSSPAAVRAVRTAPERIVRSARIYLGKAPAVVVDFTLEELDLLRRVGSGVTVDALVRSFGAELHDRIRGALFALIARRCLVFDPASSSELAGWRHVLAGRESDLPAPAARTGRALAAGRTPEAQRLYDEALAHIGSGRLALAMDRLRSALVHSPDDAAIASTAKRIARWT